MAHCQFAFYPCDAPVTHYLYGPGDAEPVPGGYCEAHAARVIADYAAKLGEAWTMKPVAPAPRMVSVRAEAAREAEMAGRMPCRRLRSHPADCPGGCEESSAPAGWAVAEGGRS